MFRLAGMICLSMLTLCVPAFAATDWDPMSDTWTATDALGRRLPGFEECGPPKPGKYVGIFYFLWLGEHTTDGPFDLTKILAANPSSAEYGPVNHFHHWGEPELGYYLSSDEWVMRYHVRMLTNAGIDVLVFDVTNGFTYTKNVLLLCKVLREIHETGVKTPQICFLANSGSDHVVRYLHKEFYSKNLYRELWFRWHGKPLILAKPVELEPKIKAFFTFRQSWAWHDPNGWFGNGKDKWPWLDHYPQEPGWHAKGKAEQISVSVAQHPMTNIGRSFHDGREPEPADRKTDDGLCFAEQWKRALEVDPEFVFITGWNEWVAQRFLADGVHNMLLGRKLAKDESFFVDTYNQEFSRDIEPMKGGHTDNYYYQMISGIRRFKGVRKPEPPSPPKTISIDGKFDDWKDVQPEYRDWVGDTAHRDSKGWGNAGTYVNNTGRNDFVRIKVTYDAKYVYFCAETRENLTSWRDPSWMLLFIDSDCDPGTGWNGYEYMVNGSVLSPTETALTKSAGGWRWSKVADISYRASGNKLELRVPRSIFGSSLAFDFHWADNIGQSGDITEFAISGDSAPDRRFNYHFEQAK